VTPTELVLLFACGFLAGLPVLLWLLAGERIAAIRNARAEAAEAEAARAWSRVDAAEADAVRAWRRVARLSDVEGSHGTD
jgi:hypothetical protein